MVRQESCVYLFIGQDSPSKQDRLRQLKEDLLEGDIGDNFNLEILYANDLSLHSLQEKLMQFAAGVKKRIVIIKGIDSPKKEIKDFLLKYVQNPYPKAILILEAQALTQNDGFAQGILRHSRVYRFQDAPIVADTFTLSRCISRKQPAAALKVLDQLLQDGEKPERIIGGLTYVCQKDTARTLRKTSALKLILACDLEIKTGRLKPNFALEKLIVGLCGFV